MAESRAETGGRRVPMPPTVSRSVAAAAPWPKVRLGEICDSISDGDHLPPPKSNEGIPFITISDIGKEGEIDFSNCYHVPCRYYDKIDEKRKPRQGDILYTVVGSFGKAKLVGNEREFCFQRHIAILRPNYRKIDSHYLYSQMRSQAFFAQADAFAIGVAQRTISLSALRRMTIPLPSLPVQRAIAKRLSAYDNLIENNKKRIAILERMAEHLYKEWFVRRRFPGHDAGVAENLTQRSRDAEEQRREIGRAASTMPPGWKVERLGNLADISTGKCNREDAEEDGVYPLFDRSQETKRSNEWIKDCEAIIVPGEGTSFMPRYYKGKFNLHQRCYCVAPQMEGIGKYLFYAIMLNRRYFLSVATGATVPSLRQNNFLSMKIIWPGKELAKRFDEVASRLFALKDNLQRQNALLSRQRDLLLPRLMSGKMAAAESLPTGQEVKG